MSCASDSIEEGMSVRDCQDMIRSTPCVFYGQLISTRTNGVFARAVYRLEARASENGASNVTVIFYPSTVDATGLPAKAILIATRDPDYPMDEWFIVGKDATVGILPDTPKNRKQVDSVSLSKLLENPAEKRIAETQARAIAWKFYSAQYHVHSTDDVECNSSRYEFGWRITYFRKASSGHVIIGSDVCIMVGDDSRIKHVQGGI